MHELDNLYEICETLDRELTEANEKIRQAGGKLSAGDLEVIDKITHSIKSVKTTISMLEEGYPRSASRDYYDDMSMRNGRNMDGRSYGYDHGMSNARGANARRDSMGRYSRGDETEEELLDKLAMIRNRR
jgi:hypothetical protein